MEITAGEAAAACAGSLSQGAGGRGEKVNGICIDTRSLEPGVFFAAIKGKTSDGHLFLKHALEKGAAGLIVSRALECDPRGRAVIRVGDVRAALLTIASYYRNKFSIPFAAVTGSSGKTTTREMLCSIVSKKFKVLCSQKNYNNELGLPLTIFRLDSSIRACVLEMGMSRAGEISILARAAKPRTGVITNVGPSHFENFKSMDEVAAAKAEILPGLKEAVLNIDDPYYDFFRQRAQGDVRTFGLNPKADFCAENISQDGAGTRFLLNGELELFLPARGRHNVLNSLAAVAASSFMGCDADDFRPGLADFIHPPMRLEHKKIKGFNVIDDSYNSNPHSLAAAAEVLGGFPGRKIFVMGDMLELGSISKKSHEEAGSLIAAKKFDLFLACGGEAVHTVVAARRGGMDKALHFRDKSELIKNLLEVVQPSDNVLVKGSRGAGMEEVVGALQGAESSGKVIFSYNGPEE